MEAIGGILDPSRVSARVVLGELGKVFPLGRDAVLETVGAMGALAARCKIFYQHIWVSEADEDSRVRRAYDTIFDKVPPAIDPCEGKLCPACDSERAMYAQASAARRSISPPPGLAPPVMESVSGGAVIRRRPLEIRDLRFEKGRLRRDICCDGCGWWFRGNAVGAFYDTERMPAPEFRRWAWERGEWDASWYCIACFAKF